MKNISRVRRRTRGNIISLLFATAVLMSVGLACSGAKDARPAPAEYFGTWRASDGSSVTIRPDGSADYRSGATKVTGGKAQVSDSEKTLSITLVGMGPTFKIDKAPADDRMTLDGVVYKRDRVEE